MPLRDRLREEALKVLYEKGNLSVLTISTILNVEWQTAKRILEELAKIGYVILIPRSDKFPFQITASLTDEGGKFAFEMFSADEGKLNPSEKLLLIIIHAVGEEVKGTTKLEKLPFLLEHDLNVSLNDIFKYFPYLYGPYSAKIIDNVNSLRSQGFLNVDEKVHRFEVEGDKEKVTRIYTLTLKGHEVAKSMFQRLPEEVRNRLVELRRYAQKSTRELLDYVYTKYPDFKKHTVLDEF